MATKMLTLWALAITLAVHAEALGLLTAPTLLGGLPVENSLLLPGQSLLLPGQSSRDPPVPRRPGGTPPAATYYLSRSHLEAYLNATLPPQIEKMLTCAETNLAGLLGTVLDTVTGLDLLSLLDITSSLNILGDGGLGGILGKGGSGKSSSLPPPPPPLSKAPRAARSVLPLVGGLLGGLLPNSRADDSSRLSNSPSLLDGVLNQVGGLTEVAGGLVNGLVPGGGKGGLSGLLGGLNLKDLLIGLKVQKVTVENMRTTMTDDEILVQAMTTTFVGGKGLLGPVISLLGFQVNADVTLKIGISLNDNQCVNLQVQDKDIKVKKVYLRLVKSVTDALPLNLPLDDVLSELLTVEIKKNMRESKSCEINLSDFAACNN
ncbi:vomeromodulin-like [Saccopteryx leptura]|uniref:vomeromodulin-like n=1 Tax=Saccopteryx leptura TaxID=249018 RepID=UPI00339C0340